jgi:uncharacterized protein (DUF1800 family)
MILYLDLQQNVRGDPNENFARELFELFMLGEGHYEESDIKEAARAFTGYKTDGTRFRFVARQHDTGRKTIFGKKGSFAGSDVIDIALQQPAARTFLPGELLRFYLSNDIEFDAPVLDRLGDLWRGSGFNLKDLATTVFQSRLFYHPAFRGNMIKSPTQYYIGMLQDLGLEVPPFAREAMSRLRGMGQPFFAPPNVRGWVGGRRWINASTLSARQQTADWILSPLEEENLNADDYAELMVARLEGRGNLTLTKDHWARYFGSRDSATSVSRLAGDLLSQPITEAFADALGRHRWTPGSASSETMRNVMAALLQSPQYQLC